MCALMVGCIGRALPALAQASMTVGPVEVQLHGSLQQGFAISDENNFLTMGTDGGTAEMTDGAFNVSSQLTRRLRAGAQLYVRHIGDLGKGKLQADWAYADYRFGQAFGVRAGKVKTALGLYNDTQDMEFLHTWAVLPQGVYPLDFRAVTIAHVGVDAYGVVSLRRAGSVSYTAYAGSIPDDLYGGYRYGAQDAGVVINSPIETRSWGGDVRWSAPLDGLMVGYSRMSSTAQTDAFVPRLNNAQVHGTVMPTTWISRAVPCTSPPSCATITGDRSTRGRSRPTTSAAAASSWRAATG
jgi:hypothetical protein